MGRRSQDKSLRGGGWWGKANASQGRCGQRRRAGAAGTSKRKVRRLHLPTRSVPSFPDSAEKVMATHRKGPGRCGAGRGGERRGE
jgi:hypothetical protein